MKLTVNMMTRGRPKVAAETIERTLSNITRKDTTLMVLLDEDDETLPEFMRIFSKAYPPLYLSVRAREDSRGQKYDRALIECTADVYLPTCDYAPILTKGFDELILDAAAKFPDGIGCVYTDMANMSFPYYQGVTAKLVKLMGYIYPPYFPFWFIDHWLDDISRMVDRISHAPVAVDHTTLFTGKTIGMRDLEFWAWLYDAGRYERRRQATKIIDALDEPEWRKSVLVQNFPLVEHRSMCINHGVRVDAARIEQDRGGVESAPDERYLRIKARADKLFEQWSAEFKDDVEDAQARLMSDIVQAAWDRDQAKVTSLMVQWRDRSAA